jgi:hypothetical protein
LSYYEDELSKWYISSNNKHSSFINQIKDQNLKDQIDTVLDSKKYDNSFDTRFNWEVKGNEEQFSVWVDQDPNKHKLYRLTPGADSSSVPSSQETKQSSGFGNKQDFSPKGFFDSKSHDLVLLEDYKEKAANDFSIRPLTTREKTPNNFVFFVEGKKEVWLWIGKWIKPN